MKYSLLRGLLQIKLSLALGRQKEGKVASNIACDVDILFSIHYFQSAFTKILRFQIMKNYFCTSAEI